MEPVAEPPDEEDDDAAIEAESVEEVGDSESDVDEELVELPEQEGVDDGDIFGGIDDSSDEDDSGQSDPSGAEPTPFGQQPQQQQDDFDGGSLATSMNHGFARLAVIGLDEEYKISDRDDPEEDSLEYEFRETLEEFRFGYYAEECVHEYVMVDDDDAEEIPPWLGLSFAALTCMALIVIRRPDRDEILGKARGRLPSIRGGEEEPEAVEPEAVEE